MGTLDISTNPPTKRKRILAQKLWNQMGKPCVAGYGNQIMTCSRYVLVNILAFFECTLWL